MRRVKIVCTIGPATQDNKSLRMLIRAGMNVARLNFSHGDHSFYKDLIQRIRQVAEEENAPVAVLQDLQGPKIRVGKFEAGSVELKKGSTVELRVESDSKVLGSENAIYTSYPKLNDDLSEGQSVLLDDGNLELKVISVDKKCVKAEVQVGGILKDRKGMNLPDSNLSISGFTEKDRKDLIFGLTHGVDFVALSFVRHEDDVKSVQKLIHARKRRVPIIAKIEKPEAVNRIDSIIDVADGIMVARGDMAVEMGNHVVPMIQKEIIRKCNESAKPVITATQMLESMVHSPRPTRAEASDVANAVFDGSDAVMLSAETASGEYPIEAVQTMSRIALETELNLKYGSASELWKKPSKNPMRESIEKAAVITAENLGADGIACITNTASTARRLSRFRPKTPIWALTDQKEALRKMSLLWGVYGILIKELVATDDVFKAVDHELVQAGAAKRGDVFVLTAGVPVLTRGTTNMLKIQPITFQKDDEDQVEKPRDAVLSYATEVQQTGQSTTFILDQEICIGCRACVEICPHDIYKQKAHKAEIVQENCTHCSDDYACVEICPTGAVEIVKTS